jgi:hypothetical protein
VHTFGALVVPLIVNSVPAGQSACGVHDDWLGKLVYVPAAQAAHMRSALELASATTWLPGAHSLQALHTLTFSVALKEPPAQPAHWRFVVVEPGTLTKVPAAQATQEAHESALALPL